MKNYEAVVLSMFGTSDQEAYMRSYEKLYKEIREIAGKTGLPVMCAFGSRIVREKRAALGLDAATLEEVLTGLEKAGVRHVYVMAVYLSEGHDYRQDAETVGRLRERFEKLEFGRPFLQKYGSEIAAYIENACPAGENDRYVLLGHGLKNSGNPDYDALMRRIAADGRSDIVLQLMSDEIGISSDMKNIAFPLMLCAGRHISTMNEKLAQVCGSFVPCTRGLLEEAGFRKIITEGFGKDPE